MFIHYRMSYINFQDLLGYHKGFDLFTKILDVSNLFQKEKTYYLTEQIRRSSRSVSVNMIEAFRNRLYPNHFINKLTNFDTKKIMTYKLG